MHQSTKAPADFGFQQEWAAGGADATRRLGSALEGVSVSHLHVGWEMALLCLGSTLPRWLVRAFALRSLFLARGRVVS
jgi:hypothetical protein